MKKRFNKISEIILLLFSILTWIFSTYKLIQYLNLAHFALGADVGISVESSAQSQVSGGEGKASMKVTTEVNGQKEELTSDEPGEIKITVEDGQVKKEVNTIPAPSPSPTASPSPSPSPTTDNQFQQMQNDLEKMWQNLFNKLSEFLGLKST